MTSWSTRSGTTWCIYTKWQINSWRSLWYFPIGCIGHCRSGWGDGEQDHDQSLGSLRGPSHWLTKFSRYTMGGHERKPHVELAGASLVEATPGVTVANVEVDPCRRYCQNSWSRILYLETYNLWLSSSYQGNVFDVEITKYELYVRYLCLGGSKPNKPNPRHQELSIKVQAPEVGNTPMSNCFCLSNDTSTWLHRINLSRKSKVKGDGIYYGGGGGNF